MKVHHWAELREICPPVGEAEVPGLKRRGVDDENLEKSSLCRRTLGARARLTDELANAFQLDHPHRLVAFHTVAHRHRDCVCMGTADSLGCLDCAALRRRGIERQCPESPRERRIRTAAGGRC